ncbi:hypothetical protein PSTT_12292 [Puccinia striiformis]|uniref:Uncharacterized protein n=1 Tax=Puccinia striiformis TaxID=27350 RepID=A0A2S4UWU4_9BASI|nr:hypothetical protein PSTT_12292 [Puccinia striiformis]
MDPRSTKPPESVGTRSARQTPRQEYYAEEEVPLPGGFPTPKVTPLTTEAVGKLRSQGPTPYSTSLKSSATRLLYQSPRPITLARSSVVAILSGSVSLVLLARASHPCGVEVTE